jgi:hypothetical protein
MFHFSDDLTITTPLIEIEQPAEPWMASPRVDASSG